MIKSEFFICKTSSTHAFKQDAILCSSNATNAAEIWTAWGTCLAAAFAAAAVVVAFRSSRADKKRHRRQEVREATASLIRALHDLATQSHDTSRDNVADRNSMYQTSVLFELAAGDSIDRDRFNAAINWILKASRQTHAESQYSQTYSVSKNQLVTGFIGHLVREATESLRSFDAAGGNRDLTPNLAYRFEQVFLNDGHSQLKSIRHMLTKQDNFYKRLVLKNMPEPA